MLVLQKVRRTNIVGVAFWSDGNENVTNGCKGQPTTIALTKSLNLGTIKILFVIFMIKKYIPTRQHVLHVIRKDKVCSGE
jgi:hypothetical protein